MAREKYLHFRADEDLVARIDALTAQSPGKNRSQVMRALLHEALGNGAQQAALDVRRRLADRIAAELAERLPAIAREVAQERAEG